LVDCPKFDFSTQVRAKCRGDDRLQRNYSSEFMGFWGHAICRKLVIVAIKDLFATRKSRLACKTEGQSYRF
jgi:hypothetical protein